MQIKRFYKDMLFYGFALGLCFYLLEWSKFKFLILDHSTEIYILIIALIFTATGVWAGLKFAKPCIVVKQKIVEIPVVSGTKLLPKEDILKRYALSAREYEVLKCIERGMKNEEIAIELFVSQNTVKTHISNIYSKLAVNSRTQALDKTRAIGL